MLYRSSSEVPCGVRIARGSFSLPDGRIVLPHDRTVMEIGWSPDGRFTCDLCALHLDEPETYVTMAPLPDGRFAVVRLPGGLLDIEVLDELAIDPDMEPRLYEPPRYADAVPLDDGRVALLMHDDFAGVWVLDPDSGETRSVPYGQPRSPLGAAVVALPGGRLFVDGGLGAVENAAPGCARLGVIAGAELLELDP